jgi:hypothetical protein
MMFGSVDNRKTNMTMSADRLNQFKSQGVLTTNKTILGGPTN